ncbi:DUF305 domain-containing protein [Streptomyces sp. DT224]|uniref:DUF305 domain-containing protein n=1 Tax=unclassified Streptomyces TaxID=2593676 RepID=UPI0011CD95E6|nr:MULTISPECIES: DUF305 domain-containing protein [unclassified Streptomyces]TXS38258.1 DUF305 domain-containing protein [Streptomyces sp. or43]WRZ03568.1 DUF305 domain-containing protein [Streptomyces sp. NBC_00385]
MSPRRPVPRWFVVSALLLGLCGAAGAIAVAIPGRTQAAQPVPAGESADAGFARDMAVHHQQAVEMSFLVRDNTRNEELRRLAFDVINTQANQRGMMLGWLDMWGASKVSSDGPMRWMKGHSVPGGAGMPGMATRAQLERLRSARGKAAEVLYLQLMIPHHQGGVVMARAAAQQVKSSPVRGLAAGIVRAQKSEISLMRDMLAQRSASRSPTASPSPHH